MYHSNICGADLAVGPGSKEAAESCKLRSLTSTGISPRLGLYFVLIRTIGTNAVRTACSSAYTDSGSNNSIYNGPIIVTTLILLLVRAEGCTPAAAAVVVK